jgi:hypothetical protein
VVVVDTATKPLAAEAELLYELIAADDGDIAIDTAASQLSMLLHDDQHDEPPGVDDAMVELGRRRAATADPLLRHDASLPRTVERRICSCRRCVVATWLHAAGAAADPAGWLEREWQRILDAHRAKRAIAMV